ncbi:MAG: amidase [Phycisphaerae bacterium]|nr:amidase [Saprospiraceae bacterium]
MHLAEATIADVQLAYQSGELTARQLVEWYIKRIEAYNHQGPNLHAVITLNPHALVESDRLDAEYKRTGNFVGTLHGIPVLLKDNVETKDMPTTGGSLSMEGYMPQSDAPVARLLREAGAIIIAKANLHEFAIGGETGSSLGGQTLNPYDLTRTPGGSSGGTAVGLAANFAILGIGTDTVNSVRSPASANAIVGIRPTLGLGSRKGIVAACYTMDAVGAMARTVEDATKMLNVLGVYDPADAMTAWSVGNVEEDYTIHLKKDGVRGKRIGVLRSFFGKDPIHQEVNEITNKAIEQLKALGAVIVEMDTPDLDANILASEMSIQPFEHKKDLDDYLSNPAANMPIKSVEEWLASGKYYKPLENYLKQICTMSRDDAEYKDRMLRRGLLQERTIKLFADDELDAIVFPHQKRLVVPVGQSQADRNGILGALTGFPSIVVPGGFSKPDQNAPIGVPIGIEFLGKSWSEGKLIEIGYGFEQGTRHRIPPVSTPALPGEP